jgi:hypothetical protein
MKKFIAMLLCIAVTCGTAAAQNCSQFVNSVNGKKLTYINQDAKGNQQMTAVYTSTKKDASTISTHAEISDKNGKLMGTGDSEMICDTNMQAGQALDDGSVAIEMNGNGSPMTQLQMDIVNRKVEQAETISTNAGSFDCFKISYEATTKVKIAGIGIPFHMKITEWYAPKLGRFVKSETYTKGGKLIGIMVLDSVK